MACRRCSSSPAGLPWSWRGGDGREGLARVAAEAAVDAAALLSVRAGLPPLPPCRPGAGVRGPSGLHRASSALAPVTRGLGLGLPFM